jgi:hypothetical protein
MNAVLVRAGVAAATLAAMMVITGCAGRNYVRETTRMTAGHVESLQHDYDRYLRRVEQDAAYRIDLLAHDRQRLARAEQSLQLKVDEWKNGRPALLDGFMTQGDERIRTDRAIAQRAETERKTLTQGQQKLERDALGRLKELAKGLHELAEPAPFTADLKFYVEYFQAVNKATSDLDAKARETKDKADTTQPKSSGQ